jgi:hypothetical protein
LACVAAIAAGAAGSAGAGGSSLGFERAEYLPGDAARATGRLFPVEGSGWLDDGPFFVWAMEHARYSAALAGAPWPSVPAEAIRLGQLQRSGGTQAPATSFHVDFRVPDVPPGYYTLIVCNDPCTTTIGDFVGGTLTVNTAGAPPLPPLLGVDATAIPSEAAGAAPSPPPSAAPAARPAPISVDRSAAVTDDATPAWFWLGLGLLVVTGVGLALWRTRTRARSRPPAPATNPS